MSTNNQKKNFIDLSQTMIPSKSSRKPQLNNTIHTFFNDTNKNSSNRECVKPINDTSFIKLGKESHFTLKKSPKLEENNKRIVMSPRSSCSSSSAFSSSTFYATSNRSLSDCSKCCSSHQTHKQSSSSSSSDSCSLISSNSCSSTISSGSVSSSSSTYTSSTLSSFPCELSDCNSNSSSSKQSNLSTQLSFTSNSSSSVCSSYSSNDELCNEDSAASKCSTSSNGSSIDRVRTRAQTSFNGNSKNNSFNSDSANSGTTASTTIAKTTRSNSLKFSEIENNERNSKLISEDVNSPPNAENLSKTKKCMWYKCSYVGNATDIDDSLMEHIKSKHIFSQKNYRRFRCFWKGCSVYKNPSCSFNWLERHVIDHIDTKPFVCIFNGCKRKFRTEVARERHVQQHINTSDHANNTSASAHSHSSAAIAATQSPSPIKTRSHLLLKSAKLALIQNIKNKSRFSLLKAAVSKQTNGTCITNINNKTESNKINNGSEKLSSAPDADTVTKLPNYSQILKTLTKKRKNQMGDAQVKKFKKAQFKDFVDECSHKFIEHKLKQMNLQSGKITFNANVIETQKRILNGSELNYYFIEWIPNFIIENEWVEESQFHETKQIDISELNKSKKAFDYSPFYRQHRFKENVHK